MDERRVRQRMTTAFLALALAALALLGAWLGGEVDGYAMGLVAVAGVLVALAVASLLALRKR